MCALTAVDAIQRWEAKASSLLNKLLDFVTISLESSAFLSLKIFEMMDAKARQDCIKEIDLLKVRVLLLIFFFFFEEKYQLVIPHCLFVCTVP